MHANGKAASGPVWDEDFIQLRRQALAQEANCRAYIAFLQLCYDLLQQEGGSQDAVQCMAQILQNYDDGEGNKILPPWVLAGIFCCAKNIAQNQDSVRELCENLLCNERILSQDKDFIEARMVARRVIADGFPKNYTPKHASTPSMLDRSRLFGSAVLDLQTKFQTLRAINFVFNGILKKIRDLVGKEEMNELKEHDTVAQVGSILSFVRIERHIRETRLSLPLLLALCFFEQWKDGNGPSVDDFLSKHDPRRVEDLLHTSSPPAYLSPTIEGAGIYTRLWQCPDIVSSDRSGDIVHELSEPKI